MLLWIFNSTKEAKQRITSNNVSPVPWNRIICTGLEQSTYQRTGDSWNNINGIYLKGEKGQDWLDWKNGKDAKEVDEGMLFNRLVETLRLDHSFQSRIRWERGEKGERWEDGKNVVPDINKVVDLLLDKLLKNNDFLDKVKWEKGEKGEDGSDGQDGRNWKDWNAGTNGVDGLDWVDWYIIKYIENPDDVQIFPNELGIDANKNLYFLHKGTILKL